LRHGSRFKRAWFPGRRTNEAFSVHGRTDHRDIEGAGGGAKRVDVCCKHGISDATFYKYKAKCGGMDVSDACKLKALELG